VSKCVVYVEKYKPTCRFCGSSDSEIVCIRFWFYEEKRMAEIYVCRQCYIKYFQDFLGNYEKLLESRVVGRNKEE